MIFIRLYWIGKEFYTLPLVSATLETGPELQGKSSGDLRKFLKSLFLGSVYVAEKNRSNKIKSATETFGLSGRIKFRPSSNLSEIFLKVYQHTHK